MPLLQPSVCCHATGDHAASIPPHLCFDTRPALQAEAADALARRAEAEARYAEAVEALHSRQHAGGMQV